MTTWGKRLVGGVAVLAGVVAGCGDDDDSSSEGDVERYCELVDELDQAGSDAFEGLDETSTDEDFAEAERQFLEDNADAFEELEDVAPEEIADDIDTLLEAQEERAAGGEQEETSEDVSDAEERVGEFEDENCTSDG